MTLTEFMEANGITVDLGPVYGDSSMTMGYEYRPRLRCAASGGVVSIAFHDSGHHKDTGGQASGADVLSCLISDASAFEDASDLDSFAAEYGITKPSEALRAYEACRDAVETLRFLLGDELRKSLSEVDHE